MTKVSNSGLAAWWLRVSQVWFDRRVRRLRADPTVTFDQWKELQKHYKRTFGFEFTQH